MADSHQLRPRDHLLEPVYASLHSRGTAESPGPGEQDPWTRPSEPHGRARPHPPPEPRVPSEPAEPLGVGGLCGMVILLFGLILVGSLALFFFGK